MLETNEKDSCAGFSGGEYLGHSFDTENLRENDKDLNSSAEDSTLEISRRTELFHLGDR